MITALQSKTTQAGRALGDRHHRGPRGRHRGAVLPADLRAGPHPAAARPRSCVVRGRLNRRDDVPSLFAAELTIPDLTEGPRGPVVIALPATRCTPPVAEQLKVVLAEHPGVTEVHLRLRAASRAACCAWTTGCGSAAGPALFGDLKALLGPSCLVADAGARSPALTGLHFRRERADTSGGLPAGGARDEGMHRHGRRALRTTRTARSAIRLPDPAGRAARRGRLRPAPVAPSTAPDAYVPPPAVTEFLASGPDQGASLDARPFDLLPAQPAGRETSHRRTLLAVGAGVVALALAGGGIAVAAGARAAGTAPSPRRSSRRQPSVTPRSTSTPRSVRRSTHCAFCAASPRPAARWAPRTTSGSGPSTSSGAATPR